MTSCKDRLPVLLMVMLVGLGFLGGMHASKMAYAQEVEEEGPRLVVDLFLNECMLAEHGTEKIEVEELIVRVQEIQLEVENDAAEPRGFEIRGEVGGEAFGMSMPALDPGARSGAFLIALPEGEYEVSCFVEGTPEGDAGLDLRSRLVFRAAEQ